MKITAIDAWPVWNGSRNSLFVTVDTDEGIYGVGESGLSGREHAVCATIDHFRPMLLGMDPFRTEYIWQLLFRGGFFPAQRIQTAAIAAIDIALWDIKGKALNVPVYDLLGGLARDRVVCYPHNVGHSMDEETLVESCLATKEAGWKFLRWGLPHEGNQLEPRQSILAAIRQVQAVREAVGDDIEIAFDVHTRLDLPDTLWLCNELEPYRLFFVEDPLRCENTQSYRSLRQRTSVPLAAGEQLSSKWEFRQLIEEDLIDYARIDVCIAGGLTEARKIAGWCETHYIKLATHNPLGPVSTAACLHLNLASPLVGVQEQHVIPGTQMLDVFPEQVEWKDGWLLPPEGPGLGVTFDREGARANPMRESQRMILQRADGSLTNW
ncbi:MAG: galactonate dehydratase [Anaerolineaceae bacterium]|nr:galactonate dehydratase [Anaerolineaceae bacterium]